MSTAGTYSRAASCQSPREAAQKLLDVLTQSRKEFDRELSKSAGKKLAAEIASSTDLDELFPRGACPAFTAVWLAPTLERPRPPLPELTNREGHALVFTDTRFPFLVEQLDEIATRLDAAHDWERETPDATVSCAVPPTRDTSRTTAAGCGRS